MTRDQQIAEALKLLNPPRDERKLWQRRIEEAIAFVMKTADDSAMEKAVRSKDAKKALTRYISSLSQVLVDLGALVPLPKRARFVQVVRNEMAEAEALLAKPPRHARRPVNKGAKAAVGMAWLLLDKRGCQPTVMRRGQWHRLSQVLANTDRDLRHYMVGGKRARDNSFMR